jgi:hypothetical protein
MGKARHNTIRLAAIGLCVALAAGCADRQPPRPHAIKVETERGEKGVRGEQGRVVVKVDLPGAPVEPKVIAVPPKPPAAPRSSPRPGSVAVVRERVVSSLPYPTESEADEDAIAQACDVVSRKLSELDPPIDYHPSPGEVRTDFLRKESRAVHEPDAAEKARLKDAGIDGKLVYVEYDVEVTADQVRELRSQDRVSAGLRVLGGLFALVVAGFLFLRADEWTKGYLTSWLALGAVTLAGAAAAALIFI